MFRWIAPLVLVTLTSCISVQAGSAPAPGSGIDGGQASDDAGTRDATGGPADSGTKTDTGGDLPFDASVDAPVDAGGDGTCTSTDWTPPTQASESGIGVEWQGDNNARVIDGSFANSLLTPVGATSKRLDLGGFGFLIPASAVIKGVEVKIRRKASSDGKIADETVTLGIPSVGNKAQGVWGSAPADTTYGGPLDTWGASLTQAMVTNSGFQVQLAARYADNAGNATASVDGALVRIHYCY
jgi:hypothetical protein